MRVAMIEKVELKRLVVKYYLQLFGFFFIHCGLLIKSVRIRNAEIPGDKILSGVLCC